MRSNLPIFPWTDHVLVVNPKMSSPSLKSQSLSPMRYRSIIALHFYMCTEVQDPFCVNICIRCKVLVKVHFLAYGCPVPPALFVEKATLPPLNCLGASKISWAYLCGSGTPSLTISQRGMICSMVNPNPTVQVINGVN